MQTSSPVDQALLDSLSANVAVLDAQGMIIAVNKAWLRFATENGGSPALGSNYLHGAGGDGKSTDGRVAQEAIAAVLERRSDRGSLEYPCSTPAGLRWFLMDVTPLDLGGGGAIVAHIDITSSKQREVEYSRHIELETSISAIYSDLLQSPHAELDVAIERGLHRIGIASGADRAHLLVVDRSVVRSRFEWCRANVNPRFRPQQALEMESLGWLGEQLLSRRMIIAGRREELAEESAAEMLASAAVQALVMVPMLGSSTAGAIVLESVQEQDWSEETLLLTHLAADTFTRVLERKGADDALREANRELEERVLERTAELRALAAKLLDVQEEERTRLARDIHDELGQSLTELNLGIDGLRSHVAGSGDAQQAIGQLNGVVSRTIQSLQRIASDLRPPVLDRLGISAALEAMVARLSDLSGIRGTVHITPRTIVIDAARATVIYRVVQEALTNVTRHARATRVRVRVRRTSDSITVTVRDNGIGIPAAQTGGVRSLGLLGMRERARGHGGRLRIAGRAGAGTVVRLTLPLEELS